MLILIRERATRSSRLVCSLAAFAVLVTTFEAEATALATNRAAAEAASEALLLGRSLEPGEPTATAPFVRLAHCCHWHDYPPYDEYCCHSSSTTIYVTPTYVAPVYGVGVASVRGVSRRTARRTSRRVSRR